MGAHASTTSDETGSRFILTATGASTRGQVAALSRFVDEQDGYIEAFDQFDDPVTRPFFARAVFRIPRAPQAAYELEAECQAAARRYRLTTTIRSEHYRPGVLILVSRPDHCLRDLLIAVPVSNW